VQTFRSARHGRPEGPVKNAAVADEAAFACIGANQQRPVLFRPSLGGRSCVPRSGRTFTVSV